MSHYQTLLVTTDFSEGALAGVVEAAKLSEDLDAKLILAYVVQDRLPPMMIGAGLRWQEIVEQHREKAQKSLEAYAEEHFPGRDVECVVRVGIASDAVLDLAEEEGVDLIVMSSRGYGLVGQLVLGSTAERVLKKSKCPVIICHAHD